MNKLKFDGQVMNLFAEDYQYLQDNVEQESSKGFRQIITDITAASVIKGYVPEITSYLGVSSTGITVNHVTIYGSTGAIVTTNGILYETSVGFAVKPLPSYVEGEYYYICARYCTILGTYNKQTGLVEEGVAKAIDYANYTLVYDREIGASEILIYTATEFAAITDFSALVVLGRVTVDSLGKIVSPVDTTVRQNILLNIPNESITNDKFNPNSKIHQTQIEQSLVINDEFSGTPANLQEDLNKVRTIIKDIKQTEFWDSALAGIVSSDPDINKLNRKGVLPNTLNNFNYLRTSSGTQIWINTGRGLTDSNLVSNYTTAGKYVDILQGDSFEVPTESHTAVAGGPRGYHIQLANFPVDDSTTPPYNLALYDITSGTTVGGSEYTVNYSTGYIDITGHGGDTIRANYYWGKSRIDILVADVTTSTGFAIVRGTGSDSPVPSAISTTQIPLIYIKKDPFNNIIGPSDILDLRDYVPYVREVKEIGLSDLSYTSTGTYNRFWVHNKLSFSDNTGNTLIEAGNGWDVTAVGDTDTILLDLGNYIQSYPYFQENDELWIQLLFPTAVTEAIVTLEYEGTINTGTLNESVSIKIHRPTPVTTNKLFYITKGFTKGYHRLRISSNNDIYISTILIGKLDLYYDDEPMTTSVIEENLAVVGGYFNLTGSSLTGPLTATAIPSKAGNIGIYQYQVTGCRDLSVYTEIDNIINTVTVGVSPSDICFDGNNIWVTNGAGSSVTKINVTSGVISTVTAGTVPTSVIYDGTNIWIANATSGNLTKIVVSTNTVSTIIIGTSPDAMYFDGTYLWVCNLGETTVSKVNTATNARTTVGVGASPIAMCFDGTHIWVANAGSNTITKITASNDAVVTLTVGAVPLTVIFDGTYIWVSSDTNKLTKINASTNAFEATITIGNVTTALCFDGTYIWVANSQSDNVSKIHATTYARTTIVVGTNPNSMFFDGKYIWVSNRLSDNVSKINVSTNVRTTVTTGDQPETILFDGQSVWVCNNNSFTLTRINDVQNINIAPESLPTILSTEVTYSSAIASLSSIPVSTDPLTKSRRIYRSKKGSSNIPTLVGVINDNITTTFFDVLPDGVYNYTNPNSSIKDLNKSVPNVDTTAGAVYINGVLKELNF